MTIKLKKKNPYEKCKICHQCIFVIREIYRKYGRTVWQRQGQRSRYDVAHVQPPTNIATKKLFPTLYGF